MPASARPDGNGSDLGAPGPHPDGLSQADAERILAAEGPNRISTEAPPRLWSRVGRQFADPLVALLLAAALVTGVLRDVADTVVILLVVTVNTAIGVAQELRADRAIAALRQLAAPTARVVRDRTHRTVPAADLVRGDHVILGAGDVVPADILLAEAQRFAVDESALTGESLPVGRRPDEEIFAGTVVLTGRGSGTVVRTGAQSALGRIAAMVAAARPGPTPLQRRLAGLSRVLGLLTVALSAVVLGLGLLAGEPLVRMAITAVSLVVAAVPESLPAVVTLALALGARRMASGHAIARRLHAVETLGSVTVVASDKTGTITEGRMAVARAVTGDGSSFDVHGDGYQPSGRVEPSASPALIDFARAGLLCNDARLRPPDEQHPRWTVLGDPLEGALVAFAGRCGLDLVAERKSAPRVREEPFDERARRMVTVHQVSDDEVLVICKGAPETVLVGPTVDADEETLARLREHAKRLAEQGLRVLAVAAVRARQPGGGTNADAGHERGTNAVGLEPLGLVGIGDPIRANAVQVAEAFRQAGIRLVLITGDHPATATSIAERLGLWQAGDIVVSGAEEKPTAHARQVRVFARIRPEQKLDIVAALRDQGQVVAMTGDGVNDAPALRQADIGVAMGAGGTEVARQAADLVLTDDNLTTVANAVGEGRRIYDNIRRFLRYGLSGGAAELAVMLLGPAVGLPLPLLPAQILWVNLLTHGVPGVAMGAEPMEPGAMRRPPRSPQESVLGDGLAASVLAIAAVITACVLGAALYAKYLGAPWQSVAFMVLGLSQLGVALAVRAPRGHGQPGNPWLLAAVVVSALAQVAGVLLPPLRALLGTDPLTVTEFAGCVLASLIPAAVVLLARGLRRVGRDGHS